MIAGAGPTGLMLAGGLALASVDVAIVDRRARQDLAGSYVLGLTQNHIERILAEWVGAPRASWLPAEIERAE